MSLSPSIVITLTSKDRQMLDSLKRVEKGLDKLSANKLQASMKQVGTSADAVAGKLVGMAAGYLSVTNAAQQLISINHELQKQASDLANSYDEAFRRFRIQANMRGVAGEAAQKRITDLSIKYAINPLQGAAAAENLVSSGFSADEASGRGLEELFRLTAATNQTLAGKGQPQVEFADMAEAVASYLDAYGMEKTGDNLKSISGLVNETIKQTTMKLTDFGALAAEASSLQGKVTPEEHIATAGVMRKVGLAAPEVATALRNTTSRMGIVTTAKEQAAFDSIGLDPKDVDMIGESFITALERMRTALDATTEEQRRLFMKTIFEERGMSDAGTLLQPGRIEEIKALMAAGVNQAQFDSDVQEATSGKAAGAKRMQFQQEARLAQSDMVNSVDIRTAAREAAVKRGMSETEAKYRAYAAYGQSWVNYVNPFGSKDERDPTSLAFTLFAPQPGGGALSRLGGSNQYGSFKQSISEELSGVRAGAGQIVVPKQGLAKWLPEGYEDDTPEELAKYGRDNMDTYSRGGDGEFRKRAEMAFMLGEQRAKEAGNAEQVAVMKELITTLQTLDRRLGEQEQKTKENTEATRQNTQAKSTARPKLASSANVRSAK